MFAEWLNEMYKQPESYSPHALKLHTPSALYTVTKPPPIRPHACNKVQNITTQMVTNMKDMGDGDSSASMLNVAVLCLKDICFMIVRILKYIIKFSHLVRKTSLSRNFSLPRVTLTV